MSRRLSRRERATAAASLMELRSQGIDPSEVERAAETLIHMGTPEAQAWSKAFGRIVDAHPALRAPLMRIEKFVERADTPTLARYTVALERAHTTGDQAALKALAPEVANGLAQMAQETGDAGFADMLPDTAIQPTPAPAAPQTEEATPRPGWQPGGGYRPSEAKQGNVPGEVSN